MLPAEEIQKYGGKGAIISHIREKLPDMAIPPYFVMNECQTADDVASEFNQLRKPVIVRSSSPDEYGDFEGIFDSQKNVNHLSQLESAVKSVRESAESDRAKIYAQQNGFGKMSPLKLIVQEQSDSAFCGAMMRHPNNPDLIYISYFSGRGRYNREYSHFLFRDSIGGMEKTNHFFFNTHIDKETAKFLVGKYKQIESLTQIAEGYSLFVEFGLEPFALYQARPFKKIETADFELPKDKYKRDRIWSDFAFGITSPEGIVLPVVRSFGVYDLLGVLSSSTGSQDLGGKISFRSTEFTLKMNCLNIMDGMRDKKEIDEALSGSLAEWHRIAEMMLRKKPYCFMTSSVQRYCYDIDLTVPNMKGMVIGDCSNFLVHNLVRLFKKADISLGVNVLLVDEFWNSLTSLEDKVRMICNGREAVILKE